MKKKLFFAVVLVGIFIAIKTQLPKLGIISGYAAKKVCSCSFIADRSVTSIEKDDLGMALFDMASNKLDRKQKTATSSVFGLGTKTAVYRDKLGCILLKGKDDYHIKAPVVTSDYDAFRIFPYGDTSPDTKPQNVDYERMNRAVDNFFDPSGNMDSLKTRSLLVIYKDTILIEKYANGIAANTEILGWSMTKSIINTWVGMMVKDGKVSIEDTELFPMWTDDRKLISLDDLMHMSSGLDWVEDYTKISGATTMLFDSEDIVKTAASMPKAYEAGEHWCYSSGTTNLVTGYLRSKYASHQEYLKYPYERIFNKLNMHTTIMESDESGNYIGSSYCYGTTRDWARLGMLYLHDGVWDGERLLPEGWTTYSATEVPDSKGIYGAHFWLNKRGTAYPNAPHDIFSANGYQGQRVFVIPSKDMVIVRMGLTGKVDFDTLLSEITKSIHE